MVHECQVLTAHNKKPVITVYHTKGTLNANFIVSYRKDLVTISACPYYSKLQTSFHFSLWLAKWDWDQKATTMLDYKQRLCNTNSSLIQDVFSQRKTPYFLHPLTPSLSNSLPHSFKVLLLLRAAIWLNFALYFTWRVYCYYYKISPKISILFQESKRHCQLTLKSTNFPNFNQSLENFIIFLPNVTCHCPQQELHGIKPSCCH